MTRKMKPVKRPHRRPRATIARQEPRRDAPAMMIRIDAARYSSSGGGKASVAARHSKRKGTVVMLHGWAQNARVFHNRTAKLAK